MFLTLAKKPVKAMQTHKQLVNIGTTKNKRVRKGEMRG